MKTVLQLYLLSIFIFLISCATQKVDIPVFEGVDIKEVFNAKKEVSVIDTTFSITFEKDEGELRGDGILRISKAGDLNLRVYSLGFLALEVSSLNGVIKSNPRIDKNKGKILIDGLRHCFFWWDIEDYTVDELEDVFILKNLSREVWLDRRTILPVKQVISLEDGRELIINYGDNKKFGDVWYPSIISINLLRYSVKLKVEDISLSGSV
ncbi:MAG: hypothetical protein ACPL1G_07555 [Thermodesulfovibrionales bacterium]